MSNTQKPKKDKRMFAYRLVALILAGLMIGGGVFSLVDYRSF